MKKYTEPTPEDYIRIAQKVRSGEYFREARRMYDTSVNDPLAERYFYVFVSTVAILTMLVALYAMQSLYPLSRSLPFIYASVDVVEDVPRISPLRENRHQSANEALIRFLVSNFIKQYEEYSITTIDQNMNGVRSTASPELFANYQRMIQPSNPSSPVVLYQRHSIRTVKIVSARFLDEGMQAMEVVFDATIKRSATQKTARYIAQLRYEYSPIVWDDAQESIRPFGFRVTSYNTTLVQDGQ